MKRYIIIIVAMIAAVTTASAQYTDTSELEIRTQSRGMLLNRDLMSIAEMGSYAQSPFQYGTARSMAMAGAMTSLGGDATSMLINPAGLGMARSGSVTFTPMLTIQSAETSNSTTYGDSSKVPFTVSNIAAIINLYEGADTKLISLNLGVGYNKVSDLNYNYAFSSLNNSSSISRLFSRQLTQSGTSLNELYGNSNPDWSSMPTNLWGAVLGYKTGLTFQDYGDIPAGCDEPITPSSTPSWSATWLNDNTEIDQYMAVESEGSIGEYDIALGGNFANKLYFGVTLGIQSVNQRLDLIYREKYHNSEPFDGDNELIYSNYNQTIITNGVGVNIKVGATYRPTEQLRIGMAYHSPTYYNLNRQYQGSMASESTLYNDDGSSTIRYAATDSPILEDTYANKWRYRTSSKLLFGASYTLYKRAILSFDYQYENYGSMSVRNIPSGASMDLYNNIEDIYQSVTTLRMGGEFKITPSIALRGGYGSSSSMLRDDIEPSQLLDISTTEGITYYAAGIGYAPNNMVSFDLTYMNQSTSMSDYSIFYSEGTLDSNAPTAESAQSKTFSTKIKQHNIALSMVFKM